MTTDLHEAAEAWIADDPDPRDRAELRGLLDAGAEAELADRFAGRLTFGTAGLRGVVAAGPNRMNRAMVRAATAAVAGWLSAAAPGAPASVVIGCDARHRSAEFADEAMRVLAAGGIAVHVLPLPCPTPLLAFAVRHLGTQAGIMITASHNPAPDNGYKLYLGDGAQVIPPADREIEERMGRLGPLSAIPVAASDDPLITRHGDEVTAAYLHAIAPARAGGPGVGGPGVGGPGVGGPGVGGPGVGGPGVGGAALTVVYTPMHGVAGELMLRAIERAGYPAPHVVAAQATPDPDFPTVAFPNPEEPGALDLAFADARRVGADLILANDPDGDRLAVAVPDRSASAGADASADAGWRRLTGDQVGALLGAAQLRWTSAEGSGRLAATTIVSSTMLSRIAAAAGVGYAETLTGFKWVARSADDLPDTRFVFGYEEALGYCMGDVVRDKDGMSAALAMLRLATEAGLPLPDLYDDLETEHGVHLTTQVTLRTHDQDGVMRRLRANPPATLGGHPVTSTADLADGAPPSAASPAGLPPSDVLIFRLDGARVVLRPSGTEPKIKCYIEIVEPLAGRPLTAARQSAADRLNPLRADLDHLMTTAE